MKLTYRDKVILAIVLAVAIFAGGFFGLIKPKRQTIKDNQETLDTLETEKKEIEKKIRRIKDVAKKIDDEFEDTKSDTAIFVDVTEINETKKLDEFMYKYAEDSNVKVTELKTDPVTSSSLNYYYESYVELAGALRESADINGSLRKKVAEESADSNYISSRGVENIMSTRYGLTVEGTKKDIWDYLDRIENIKSAIIITSVSLDAVEEEDDDDDKKPTPKAPDGQNPQDEEKKDKSNKEWTDDTVLEASIVIQLYSVYEMEKPDTSEKAAQ